jgi:hypothetical protein
MIKLTGEVGGGKFVPDTPQYFRDAVAEHEGKRIEVWIGRENVKRSREFNNLYFGYLVREYARHTGYAIHEAHYWLKYHTIGVEERVDENGRIREIEKRTRYMSNAEFADFVRSAELWCFENGIIQVLQIQEAQLQ